MAYFPIFIEIEKKKCLVVGGGKVALRKVETLLRYDAQVHVVSREICEEIRTLLPPEILDDYLKSFPMKRMLKPEEIANVYLFLASDLANGITATTISVDGAYRP